MIWHPLLMAVLVGDLLGFLFLLAAAKTAFRISIHWAPQSARLQQIRLERAAESAALSAKFALAAFWAATLVLIVAITNVLPALIPGAMCGTGVLQATGGFGGPALFLRLIVFGILYIWLILEKLNSKRPDSPLAPGNARLLLLVVPFYALAVSATLQAIFHIDAQQPVDCCAVVYDQFRDLSAANRTAGFSNTVWLWIFWMLSALLILCGWQARRTGPTGGFKFTGWLALAALLWVPTAALVLVNVFSAYYYQVLHHHCPWCLFLPEHRFVGVPLFAALAVVLLEGPVFLITARLAAKYPQFKETAALRARIAVWRLLLAAGAFMGMVTLPAIWWRLQFGVWIR
jgi:hypothetical protein